ncbi:response regulator [Nitrincola iocasae]|uniref:Response regulator n=1 Tax=Nitrincola iocasae TaxID=2614693 RepID=A0A5J6LDM3_9GAMM|nr:response regulator [Nitrincola iocasae]QEW06729.1 response regulator [Nitrincola iocasae]
MKEDVCTSRKAAELLGVTPRTIQLWADAGILDSWKTPGGHRRFSLQAVEQLSSDILSGQHHQPNEGLNGYRTQTTSQTNSKSPGNINVEPARVLVVDDDKTLLRLYELTLASWGLPVEVILANDGYQGLIEVGRFNPDLLILDLQMPNIDGFAVIEALQQQKLLDQMCLMVISGLENDEIAQRISLPESCTLIQKPIPFLRIREQVENILLQK